MNKTQRELMELPDINAGKVMANGIKGVYGLSMTMLGVVAANRRQVRQALNDIADTLESLPWRDDLWGKAC